MWIRRAALLRMLPALVGLITFIHYQYAGYATQTFLALNHAMDRVPDIVWTGFSLLGNGWSAYALLLPALLWLPSTRMAVLCTAPIAAVVIRAAKVIIDSPRPAGLIDPTTFHIVGEPMFYTGMPSGHTLTAFALAAAVLASIKAGRWVAVVLFLSATAAGLSRIAVGAHWLEDVLTGAALGIYCGWLGAWLAAKFSTRAVAPQRWPVFLIQGLGLLSVYILLTTELDFPQNEPLQYLLVVFIASTTVMYWWRRQL